MFDLEAFRAGVPAIARNGEEWTYLYDLPTTIVAANENGLEFTFYENGRFLLKDEFEYDLVAMKAEIGVIEYCKMSGAMNEED